MARLMFEDVHARLNRALPGDANKTARREWMRDALGHVDMPPNLFLAFQRADDEQRAHVERLLEQLERRT
jgi:hypothetical protein